MSEYAEYEMLCHYRGFGAVSPFPKGWMSKPNKCPECERMIKGGNEGMSSHLRMKHGYSREDAITASRIFS